MQRLEYVNLRGDKTVFGGEPPYVLEHVDGLGLAPMELISHRGVYQQGVSLQRLTREARVVECKFHVEGGESRANMYQKRIALLAELSPQFALDEGTGTMAKLYYENDYGRWWTYAVPKELAYVNRLQNYMVSCPLDFSCPSPYWRGDDDHEVTLEMATGAFRLRFGFPITLGNRRFSATVYSDSQVDTPVNILIEGHGEMPTLANHTTGKSITVQRAVASGEFLEISTDEDNLYVNLLQADKQVIPAYGYLSLDSALSDFVLRPGDNRIEYIPSEASESSKVTVTWETRLEGV